MKTSEIAQYLESKKDLSKFKKSDKHGEISYFLTDNNANEYFYNISTLSNGDILLNFQEKIIITGRSLADPRATYQTTSAHTYTTKRRKLQRAFSDFDKLKKAINKFFSVESTASDGIKINEKKYYDAEGFIKCPHCGSFEK